MILKNFLAFVIIGLSVIANASTQKEFEINDDWIPTCYYGDKFTALQNLLALDFDPSLSQESSYIEGDTLNGVQFDENGEYLKTYKVPPCATSQPPEAKEVIDNEGDYQSPVSYACFETMADIQKGAGVIEVDPTSSDKDLIAQAKTDAALRVKPMNKSYPAHAQAYYSLGALEGIKVTVTDPNSEEYEYGDYFLYKVTNNALELLSAHYGDDQGPTLKVYCSGWSQGKKIK